MNDVAATQQPPRPTSPKGDFNITAEDIRSRIPKEGIQMGELLKFFTGQIVGKERRERFMDLLKKNSKYMKESKTLVPVD